MIATFKNHKLTKIVNISFGQNINISLTHIMQMSLSSCGTKELQRVKSLVAISPISFHLAKMCLQSGDFEAFAGFELAPAPWEPDPVTSEPDGDADEGCKDMELDPGSFSQVLEDDLELRFWTRT